MPSSLCKLAPVGQTSTQAGSSQWLQSIGTMTFSVVGNFPRSLINTLFQRIPRGKKCSSLQEIEQPQHPTHFFKSITIPHLGMERPPFS
jgi:hypothetical protein